MPEAILRLRVFVASPGDVPEERNRLEALIDELNRTIAPAHQLMLELVRWESHARAGFGADLQDVINQQLLAGEEHPADIFVGIMWKRLGTPTNRAESGTAEEFERAYASLQRYGKPAILFYFNATPYHFRNLEELEQYQGVLEFRKRLKELGGLTWEYQGAADFEGKVREHLIREVLALEGRLRQAQAPAAPAPATPAAPAADARPPAAPATPPPNNLPSHLAPMVGRDVELSEVAEQLRGRTRLVTIYGPAGVGKTRLAIQAGSDLVDAFPDGICFVQLESVLAPELVASEIVQALELQSAAGQSDDEVLIGHLRARSTLLVLDHFEHVHKAKSLLEKLLQACPSLKIIATSRRHMHLRGEHAVEVRPFAVPRPGDARDLEQLERNTAVQVFIEYARAARPDFELSASNAAAIVDICRRLDGLPLALELVAARVRMLPLPAIAGKLQQNLSFVAGRNTSVSRSSDTLLAAIGSSYDLLSPEEQTLFRQLSIFVGGWTFEAMEAVVEGVMDAFDSLTALIDHSLVRLIESDTAVDPRYMMLDTIRQFALEQRQAQDDEDALRRRHAEFYLNLAETALPQLNTKAQLEWLERLDAEQENLRAALSGALEAWDVATALQLGAALWRYWSARGHLAEGRERLNAILALAGPDSDPLVKARLLSGAGWLAHEEDDFEPASSFSESALALYRSLPSFAASGMVVPLLTLGFIALKQRDYERAGAHWTEALEVARAANDRWGITYATINLGGGALLAGRMDEAKQLLTQGLNLARQLGDRFNLMRAFLNLGRIALEEGEFAAANAYYDEGRELTALLRDRRLGSIALLNSGYLAFDRGDYEQALGYFCGCLTLSQEIGNRLSAVHAAEQVASTWVRMQQYESAARLFGAVESFRTQNGFPRSDLEQKEYAEIESQVREALGPATFDAVMTIGRHASFEDATTFASEAAAVLSR